MKLKLCLLMMLVAGLVACSGGDDGLEAYDPQLNVPVNEGIGEFDGEWIIDQQVVDTARLVMTNEHFQLRLPEEQLLRYALGLLSSSGDVSTPGSVSPSFDDTPDYQKAYETSDNSQWSFQLQGFSENKAYYEFYDTLLDSTDQNAFSVCSGKVLFILDNEEAFSWPLAFYSNEPKVAIFDRDTKLWTIKITLNKMYEGSDGDKIWDLPSHPVLLFVAKRRI